MSCSVMQHQKSTKLRKLSGPSALNFSHLPGWYFDQKEDFLKKKLQTQEEPPAPRMANQDLIEVSTSPQSGSQH